MGYEGMRTLQLTVDAWWHGGRGEEEERWGNGGIPSPRAR